MARTKSKDVVSAVVEDEVTPIGPSIEDNPPASSMNDQLQPKPTDPEWQTFVMGHFAKEDKDPDGNPNAEACRAVVELLLGDIIKERVKVVQVPNAENDYRATVEVHVTIAWDGNKNDLRVFGGVADVYPLNMEARFAKYPTSTAKTKALGSAYKAALKLKKVYTSEELVGNNIPLPEGGFEPLISNAQMRFIDKLCRDLDVNVSKFINMGKSKYNDFSVVPKRVAKSMEELLNSYQQKKKEIPDSIKTYDANWEKTN